MTIQKDLGFKGEKLAREFLKSKGYKIIERNYRNGRNEIDIIANKDDLMIFVEVKARSGNAFGEPEDAVDHRKSEKIIDAAENYIFDKNWHGDIRFDIISIKLGEDVEILHLEDAIY